MPCTVLYVDTNGVPRIVGNDDRTLAENLSRSEAEALIARLEARHGKPHKMYYEILEYSPKSKESAYKQRRVAR